MALITALAKPDSTSALSGRAPLVCFQSVSQRYGVAEILRDINLTIEEGEIVCVVGPSGCGKTTLLRLIAGLLTASSGAVTYKDRPHKTDESSARASLAKYTTLPPKVIAGLKWPNLSTHLSIDTSFKFWNELAASEGLINAPIDLKTFVIPYPTD